MSGQSSSSRPASSSRLVNLDGSYGEGGGQILRTALSLSLLTGRPFRMTRVRANREKPGLRPQHLAAVEAAACLGTAEVAGNAVGSHELTFRPNEVSPRDLTFEIGTAGATSLVLQTLHLPLAMRAESPVRLVLGGGTFNDKAPSYPFLEATWRRHMTALGLPITLAMPAAGFYPRGGGRLEAWIEPGKPHAIQRTDRGPLRGITVLAGVVNLPFNDIPGRMHRQALKRLSTLDWVADETVVTERASWRGPGQGAAFALTVHHAHLETTFVALGARGKPAEQVADEAFEEFLAFAQSPGAVDPHTADQLLLPLALAEGRSEYTVTEVTEHLRTNARTIRAFLDREVRIEEPEGDRPGRVIVA